jgi:mRNA interferase MazF
VLVVSADAINQGPSGLSVVVPLTTRDRGVTLHVVLEPPEGGVRQRSVILPEQIHAADQARLVERWGSISQDTLRLVEDRLRIVLDLDGGL